MQILDTNDIISFLGKSYSGDLHFLWECLQVAVMEHWGKQSDPGSLCNLCSLINRTLVDKAAKTFSIEDEFVVHAFKAHLLAAICTHLNMKAHWNGCHQLQSLSWNNVSCLKMLTLENAHKSKLRENAHKSKLRENAHNS